MTTIRLLPLPLHGALQMLAGLVTMAAPFALGFSPAGMVVGVVLGTILVGLALAAVAEAGDPGVVSVGLLHDFDFGIATGLVGAALVLAVAGDSAAAGVLAAVAVAQFALNLTTRYSRAR